MEAFKYTLPIVCNGFILKDIIKDSIAVKVIFIHVKTSTNWQFKGD